MEAQCRARQDGCRIEALNVAPAVGWLSLWKIGGSGSTAVIVLDGDMLTVRSIAGDSATAKANAQAVVADLVPQLVGR